MRVTRLAALDLAVVRTVLARTGLTVERHAERASIPGSFWGAPEAGLVGEVLHVRDDTPVHSALHEAAHYACMSPDRRAGLHTDAGGDHAEEDAVCYLQLVWAEHIPGYGREQLFADMDAWGYSFRLGSARRWFAADADDARGWLLHRRLIHPDGSPTWHLADH